MSYSGTARDLKRAIHGAKVQDEMREAFAARRDELKEATDHHIERMELKNMFSMEDQTHELEFKESIIGLVTREEFLAKKKRLLEAQNKQKKVEIKKKKKKNKKIQNKKKRMLSFDQSDGEEEQIINPRPKKKRKIGKNPESDTSYLPDVERDKKDAALKEEIRKEYHAKQGTLKSMKMEMAFSYFDGSNHRRTSRVKRGTNIGEFLETARLSLEKNYADLMGLHGAGLMFIKGDLIIPQSFNFHDLISVHACGKDKKPLFIIEEWEDLVGDNKTSAKDTAPEAKIVTRAWYERNKHTYPGNKWVTYDPGEHSLIYD